MKLFLFVLSKSENDLEDAQLLIQRVELNSAIGAIMSVRHSYHGQGKIRGELVPSGREGKPPNQCSKDHFKMQHE